MGDLAPLEFSDGVDCHELPTLKLRRLGLVFISCDARAGDVEVDASFGMVLALV